MNIRSFKNKNGLMILMSVLVLVILYSLDLYGLNYRLKGWKTFGDIPVPVSQIQYFLADTPNLIGYQEPGMGGMVSCASTVAYLRTATGEGYRCCDTGERISCLAGDFSSDIPVPDEACTGRLREAFGIPAALEGAQDFQVFGSCAGDVEAAITVVQLQGDRRILWKFLDAGRIAVLNSTLRCILGPLLLLFVIAMIVVTMRGTAYQPARRF